ncbi:MAG: DUF2461 domain-containing protein [Oscillospiraceae bacterium]|jgi:uncharacterized protein (TIGR02453 family)|nr:DUF2461 domain-containing protein [Oscillospiraceae bacterium]
MSFQGFDPAVVDFMWGLRFNNSREWFEPRKAEYKAVFETPMKELSRDLYAAFSDKHQDLTLVSRVSRIYRDARRLFGRGPYKDHLWLTVSAPAERWSCQPTFWFELTPEGYSYGLGYWMAQALTMAKLRARMDRDPKPMEKLARQLEKQDIFHLEGEEFKKLRPAPSKLLDPWYNKKGGFSLSCQREHDDLLWSPALTGHILSGWETLVPLYRYLSTLDGDPDPREQ